MSEKWDREGSWLSAFSAAIGSNVRRERIRKGLSMKALSERMSELGHGMKQSALSALENGHRNSITVADVFVIGAALGVSPLELCVGLGYTESQAVLPGQLAETDDLADWWRGDAQHPLAATFPWNQGRADAGPKLSTISSFALYLDHEDAMETVREVLRDPSTLPIARRRELGETLEGLAMVRAEMRDRSMILPRLESPVVEHGADPGPYSLTTEEAPDQKSRRATDPRAGRTSGRVRRLRLGAAVRAQRERLGLTLSQLTATSGFPVQALRAIESGSISSPVIFTRLMGDQHMDGLDPALGWTPGTALSLARGELLEPTLDLENPLNRIRP